jgi:hypothetical protein
VKGPPWPMWRYDGELRWSATYKRRRIATIEPAAGGSRKWTVVGVTESFADSTQEAIHAAGAAWRRHLQEQPAASMPHNESTG